MVDTTNFNIMPNDDEEQFTVEFGEIMNAGAIDFNELIHRPKYNNAVMTGETSIPAVPSQISELENNLNYQTEREVDAKIALEANARQQADNNLQSQIDGISASSSVKDIVGTYAELQAYDTSTLGNNDIIMVLQDEMHSDETTYYRWSTTTQAFTLVGEEGPYYTKSATDQLLATKADKTTTYTKTEMDSLLSSKQGTLTAGDNISISGNTISATGTTYTAGNAIQIDAEDDNRISADIYPADYFTASGEVSAKGTSITLNNTIAFGLDSVEICGDMNQNGTPTPDTPINTNVVTGEQTITVSDGESQSQSYTVDLGSIELCKIGDYQDYIYKSGDDWYVHKAMGKITLDGSETWSAAQMTNNWMYYTINAGMAVVTPSQMPNIISNYFSVTTTDGQWTSEAGSKSVTLNNTASPNTQIRFTVGDSTNKLADFKTWLSTHSTTVYYALETPTDTKITDATLVAQLNALAGAKSYNNQTDIIVTAAGENLPAILCVEAYQKSLNGLLGAIERLGE